MNARAGLAAALALAVAIGGCGREQEQQERADAERMRRAVSALRDADNAHKSALLAALRAVPCAASDVCALQSACVRAYDAHVAAFAESDAVRRELDADAGSPSGALLERLDRAEKTLKSAHSAAQRCAELEGEMSRKHKL